MPLHANYKSNLAEAQEFERFASDAMAHSCCFLPVVYQSKHFQAMYGESLTGTEFKYDKIFRESGNLFIETAESCHESFTNKPAGIYHEIFPWLYVIGDFSTFWIFATRCLQRQHELGNYRHVDTATSEGFLLPVRVADEVAAKKWEAPNGR
jgi:hypothetical protein